MRLTYAVSMCTSSVPTLFVLLDHHLAQAVLGEGFRQMRVVEQSLAKHFDQPVQLQRTRPNDSSAFTHRQQGETPRQQGAHFVGKQPLARAPDAVGRESSRDDA